MKQLIKFASLFSVAGILYVIACRKDNGGHEPIARAGADTTIMVTSCETLTSLILDGSASSDVDNDIRSYSWYQVAGPMQIIFADERAPKTRISDLAVGQYLFELVVSDAAGLLSNDLIAVTVKSSPTGNDLEFNANGTFAFAADQYTCPWECYYYDETSISAEGIISSLGNLSISIIEDCDTAQMSYADHCSLSFRLDSLRYAYGTSSLDLKKLIQQGGGSFSGTAQLTGGSAQTCDRDIFTNAAPLTITGTLNVVDQTISMNINGKIFF